MGIRGSRSRGKQNPTKSRQRDTSTKDQGRKAAKAKRGAKAVAKRSGHTSRYFNVAYSSRTQTYGAEITIAGRKHWLGAWSSERDAAVARDRLLLHFGIEDVPLNLPLASRRAGPASREQLRRESHLRRKGREHGSQYFGVTRVSDKNRRVPRWLVVVQHDTIRHHVVGFVSARDAAVAADRLRLHLYGKGAERLNFPNEKLKPATVEQLRAERRIARKMTETSSRYFGVTLSAGKVHAWTAQLRINGRLEPLGAWASQRDAALAVDRASLYYTGKAVNFPKQASTLEAVSYQVLRRQAFAERKKLMSSHYVGVSRRGQLQSWVAIVRKDGRVAFHQYFDDEERAARARDKAALRIQGKQARLNFDPRTGQPLDAGKSVAISLRRV